MINLIQSVDDYPTPQPVAEQWQLMRSLGVRQPRSARRLRVRLRVAGCQVATFRATVRRSDAPARPEAVPQAEATVTMAGEVMLELDAQPAEPIAVDVWARAGLEGSPAEPYEAVRLQVLALEAVEGTDPEPGAAA